MDMGMALTKEATLSKDQVRYSWNFDLVNEWDCGKEKLWESGTDVCLQEMPLVGFSFLEEALHGLKKGAIFQIIDNSKGFLMAYNFPVITSFIGKLWNLCIPTVAIPS